MCAVAMNSVHLTGARTVLSGLILQVSILNTVQNNLGGVDFGTVLLDVMTIADEEVDSQLKLGFRETMAARSAR
jgi:hypothetical protein